MVTGSPSSDSRGGGASRRPLIRYGEKFEELCAQYMAMGMSYHDYWDGDSMMAKYYREAEIHKQEKENYLAWLHGLYIYSALIDVAPILNPMSRKKKKPKQYMETPVPITKRATDRAREEENRKKMENGKNAMQMMMKGLNAKLKRREG